MTAQIVQLKLAPKSSRTRMDTIIVTESVLEAWLVPPCQRPLRVNEKLRLVAERIRQDEVIPGVITLGTIDAGPEKGTYILDGRHRGEAFKMSGVREAFADIRIMHFDNMAELGRAFTELNLPIAAFRPDDILKGLEGSLECLQIIRQNCSFVGYDSIRRGTTSPIVSIGTVIKCWVGSLGETPALGARAVALAEAMSPGDARALTEFLNVAHAAWGRDQAYGRLWLNLNLSLCMWLWRQLVLDRARPGNKRVVVLTHDQFKKCLMGLSANGDYLDWLVGRNMSERDRSPCYARIKAIFVKRIEAETSASKKPQLPQPAWASR